MAETGPTGIMALPSVRMGTKAETLERLRPVLRSGTVLPLTYFPVRSWMADRESVLMSLARLGDVDRPLIVRSSTQHEDDIATLAPGAYLSVPDVRGPEELIAAVDAVIASYARSVVDGELMEQQVLVQPMLTHAASSGVTFTRDPNTGGSYYVINYESRGDCAAVTSGHGAALRTAYVRRTSNTDHLEPGLRALVVLAQELEALLGSNALDIEFAVGEGGQPYLLQVRPLVTVAPSDDGEEDAALRRIRRKLVRGRERHPYLLGRRTLFGVMPDWNPAEIIGARPRPLALSLYRRLVTNGEWAEQRFRYGYRDVRGCPLVFDFGGMPYVDVRASCNSLTPAALNPRVADALVDHYIDRLVAHPALCDKIEFDVVFSCYSFNIQERLARQTDDLLTGDERAHVVEVLRALTNELVSPHHAGRRSDEVRLASLPERFDAVMASELTDIERVYWLLNDCRRFGTRAFAGFARLGFVAAELLRSLVALEVVSPTDVARLMAALDTSTNRMLRARAQMTRKEFLDVYGFLRPGTYDIASPRYDEAPDDYFDWRRNSAPPPNPAPFVPSSRQARQIEYLLARHGLALDVDGLFEFIKSSTERREDAKFAFSRHLSQALRLISMVGRGHGLSVDDMSYTDISVFDRLYLGSDRPEHALGRSSDEGREGHGLTRRLVLPPMISAPEQVEAFHLPDSEPNYITQGAASGAVRRDATSAEDLRGKILLLESGDPGYDWIFSTGLAGFVTQYGGANSHMAIRAHQFAVPAVIGAGETLYNRLSRSHWIEIDCMNRRVEVIA